MRHRDSARSGRRVPQTLVVSLAALAIAGCRTVEIDPASNRLAVELAELRARAEHGAPMVRPADSSSWSRATDFRITTDSVIWRDDLDRRIALTLRELEAVRYDRQIAASLGGGVVGASAGALIGAAGTDDTEWWRDGSVYAGAAAGAAVGVLVGRYFGLPITYRFASP